MGLNFFDGMVGVHGCTTANHASKIFAVFTEMVAIGKENERVLPTNKFPAHGKDGPIGVGSALLVEHLHRDIGIVQDDDMLAQNLYMGDVAYKGKVRHWARGKRGRLPYFWPHWVKVSQGLTEGMSAMLPTRGRPLGPGGNGADGFLVRTCLTR